MDILSFNETIIVYTDTRVSRVFTDETRANITFNTDIFV